MMNRMVSIPLVTNTLRLYMHATRDIHRFYQKAKKICEDKDCKRHDIVKRQHVQFAVGLYRKNIVELRKLQFLYTYLMPRTTLLDASNQDLFI